MTESQVQPPAAAVWILSRLLGDSEREAYLGDLEEVFRTELAAGRSVRSLRRWYWMELLRAPISRDRTHVSTPSGDGIMQNTFNDLRFAVRLLARRPGFTALAVLTLALGIGATTAIFSAVYPILVAPLPYPHADRVAMLWEREKNGSQDNLGWQTFDDLNRANKSFEAMAAMSYSNATMTGGDQPELLKGQRVSTPYFSVLGVAPAIGRAFLPQDDIRNTARVIVISNGLWRNRFGGDSTLIGRAITLDGNPFTVIGVMPAAFENVTAPGAQYWLPLRYDASLPYSCRTCRHLHVVGRLKPGVTGSQAAREINTIFANILRDHPTDYSSIGVEVPQLQVDITKSVRPVMLALLGAVLLVLMIASANVTNLLLARGAQRQGEFAIRAALGAKRGRVVRQLLTESLLLAAAGGLGGAAIAQVGVKALVALGPASLPRLSTIAVNGPVLAFGFAITTIVGIVFGLVPAMHASRADLHQGIKQGTRRTAGSSRLTRAALVMSEVALAIVLLVGSGLLLRSTARVFAVDPGFDAAHVLTMQVQAGGKSLPNDTVVRAFYDRVLAAVRAQPGVEAAAFTSQLPMSGDFDGQSVGIKAHPAANPADNPSPFRYGVSDGYFEAMRIPLRKGRTFTAQDVGASPHVAIVNESFAKKYWPGENPVGQLVTTADPSKDQWMEVVGVVGDLKQLALSQQESNAIYVPETQWPYADQAMSLVVRTKGDAAAIAPAIRTTIWSVNKDQPIVRVVTAGQLVAQSESTRRFALVLFEAFALVALVLAGAGIYGVLAGTVTERMREIGVRSALGASRSDIVAMVVRQGLRLTAFGAIIGVVGALALSHLIASLLFGVSPLDPATYIGVTAVLSVVALGACAVPAIRAARIDPMETLRME
ncbi:MAG TPA: ABC transporter permease [Gemmatimonadaceae bacterium]|jgi:putative ABC transport system permease protein|nr:ABC transporter permease [Gemmatimonadaceae bacterium]